jgi:hypothetical protein
MRDGIEIHTLPEAMAVSATTTACSKIYHGAHVHHGQKGKAIERER